MNYLDIIKKYINKYKFLIIFFIPIFIVFITFILIPLPQTIKNYSHSKLTLDKNGKILRVFLNKNDYYCLPPDDKPVPPKLKKAVINYEDQYFNYHLGVNPFSILRAFYQNIKEKKIVSGGSTITMQVMRIMNPKDRTYINKIYEIMQAVKLEILYSKEEILKLYLNHAPYGSNISGYRTASLKYFGLRAEKLTWGQVSLLAVLPNAPGIMFPEKNNDKLLKKRNRFLKKLKDRNVIDNETYRLAINENIPQKKVPLPFYAPHASRKIINTEAKNNIYKTTLDKKIQKNTSQIIKGYINYFKTMGIENASAIVVETKTGKVRAYAGSQDYTDKINNGCVDGVMAERSSGSTLKPFLFALNIDKGNIIPETKIKDLPTNYKGFSPQNYDEKFRGLVTAKKSLIKSLNVPSVRLLHNYGVYRFYLFLKSAGFSTLFRNAKDYGLTLIIGGAETTLWDLAKTYRGLGNYGLFGNISLLKSQDPNKNQVRLLSKGASFLTLEMMKELKRPGSEYYWNQYQNQWPIAWKTGTSYGQKDAWAIGVSPEWTIGVWVGNFSGEGNPNISGAKSAAPIMLDIFNYLPKKNKNSWFQRPSNMKVVEICADTGYRATSKCKNTIDRFVPRDQKPLKLCPYHKTIFLTKDEKNTVCSLCWEEGNYKKETKLLYPPEIAQYLRESGTIVYNSPPHKENCNNSISINTLQIIYPKNNSHIWIPYDFGNKKQKLVLKAAHMNKDEILYWYLDSKYIGKSRNIHKIPVYLNKGWHTLKIIDSNGNNTKSTFYATVKN